MKLISSLLFLLSLSISLYTPSSSARGLSYTPTPHGILFQCQSSYSVELAVASNSAFRLSFSFDATANATAWPSRMVAAQSEYASFTVIEEQGGDVLGLNASFGYVSINIRTGAWSMGDDQGLEIMRSNTLASLSGSGATTAVHLDMGRTPHALYYGAGGGLLSVETLTANASNPHVTNREFYVPHFWSTDGYATLAVAPADTLSPVTLNYYPASWAISSDSVVSFTLGGGLRGDLYLLPSRTLLRGTQAYYQLIGTPPVPPRFAFGFFASRWGWTDRAYIQDTLTHFRNGSFPLDAFICDFEWYSLIADYTLPAEGASWFEDFSYSPVTFPDPTTQLQQYHNDFHVRFGGIRKPRLGNTALLDMARARGWLLGNNERNLNYSKQEVREWYGQNIGHFLAEGVDFWWDDEGETQYYTFYDWNLAQVETANIWRPGKRFFSISRSYTPGLQRLGSTVWTGDTPVSWHALRLTAGYLQNWMLAGAGYITCDIGGFDGLDDPPDLLLRWYQLGVALPVMRIHSYRWDKPHFPWLYGARAAAIMQAALNLRYQLVPYLYSLAHVFARTGLPYYLPLVSTFPNDAVARNITTQWMVGDVMAAPVVDNTNAWNVYLPRGTWFVFNTTTTYTGPRTLSLQVQLEDFPLYVRAGSLVTLCNVLQYTDQLPGGPLHVYIYPGGDAAFTLVEDDGETMQYQQQQGVREIALAWNDSSRTLTWTTSTPPLDAHGFVTLVAHALLPTGARVSAEIAIGQGGKITF